MQELTKNILSELFEIKNSIVLFATTGGNTYVYTFSQLLVDNGKYEKVSETDKINIYQVNSSINELAILFNLFNAGLENETNYYIPLVSQIPIFTTEEKILTGVAFEVSQLYKSLDTESDRLILLNNNKNILNFNDKNVFHITKNTNNLDPMDLIVGDYSEIVKIRPDFKNSIVLSDTLPSIEKYYQMNSVEGEEEAGEIILYPNKILFNLTDITKLN